MTHMARDSSARFSAGARIGDYRVDGQLAIEETAVVYLATHVVLPRQAHIKVTHPGSKPAALQVLREACILEALSHEGIPRVHECGVLGDRRPWSAVERMTGTTFKQLTSEGPLALSELVIMLRDVADILHHAHERGVVHRRLTASTIVRTQRRRSGHAVADWGDARTLDTGSEVAVDPRDDVYALGRIAFLALTGHDFVQPASSGTWQVPGPNDPATPAATVSGASAAAHSPSAPAELTALIDQMLAEPMARPLACDVFDRAHWLCDTLEAAPWLERRRWTPPQGYVSEGVSPSESELDLVGFAVRISRARTL
jgi:serine/threonine protein kinase